MTSQVDQRYGSDPASVSSDTPDEGYQRRLTSRQVQMMSLGGAIGVGLFYGAGEGISRTGPSLIACYAGAGVIVFFIMRALGELLTYHPTSGSFADYAREFLGPFAGFVTGWSYWAWWVTACMAEVTAAGHYIAYWWPAVPVWATAATALGILFVANLISVHVFGELEFWFCTIKVVAIIGLIVIGAGVLFFGFSSAGSTASVTHLWGDGGFAPHGATQAVLVMPGVFFAYLGVELVGVTAGEAKNPKETLRKAINTLPVRIAIFYIGALVVLLSVLSWTEYSPGVSPFVQVFAKVGIPGAAGIMNFVVLTAALSSCNSGIYSSGRMLRGLAANGEAPDAVRKLSGRQVPRAALMLSTLVMGAGVVVNAVSPDKAFVYITAVGTCAGLWTWIVILAAHLRYRVRVRAGVLPVTDFRMPGAPVTNWIAIGALACVVILVAMNSDTRLALYVWVVWLALLSGIYRARIRSSRSGVSEA
ncbi:amino acid permease [Streptomyces iranensis]|uniref:AAT family amino acid transporter n=1 Tax=Streptomyces iranensis TaxID=576784 RepID=A0A060ZWB6_9ACTN|nr:amino acid permease [Streptomyces iranensis]MBP2064950.1 AAT family amino acid transporter [Streptomyces iranensis]CDR10106.1 amino acid permease-associated region [Streptomyces iranensis]